MHQTEQYNQRKYNLQFNNVNDCNNIEMIAFKINDSESIYCLHLRAFNDLNPSLIRLQFLKKCVFFNLLIYVFEIDNNIEKSSHCQT